MTLIEIMVVLAVLAIIAAVAIPSLSGLWTCSSGARRRSCTDPWLVVR